MSSVIITYRYDHLHLQIESLRRKFLFKNHLYIKRYEIKEN